MKSLRSLLRKSTTLIHSYWRVRNLLNCQPRNDYEVLNRIQGQRENPAGSQPRLFHFPWGDFEYVDLGQVRAQFEEIFIRRQYAFRTNSSQAVIIDCGGNVGLSAIWFKRNYPNCQLTVFEADPSLAAIISRNLARAGYAEVTVRNEAVWIENKFVPFRRTGDDKGKIDERGSATLPAIDLARFIPERVDLLKLDIEGSEYSVLARLCQTGDISRIRCLVCEYHIWRERTGDLLQSLTQLRKAGMKISMNAIAGPWIGKADEESPFEVIKRNHVLMEVYAWH